MSDALTEGHAPSDRRTWRRPTAFYNRGVKWAFYALVVAFVAWSAWNLRVSPDRLSRGLEAGRTLLEGMWPPNFGPRQRDLIRRGIVESLAMSVVATVVGVLVSVPVAFMAAENLASRPVYYVGRTLVSASRAFHELVVAIVAVKAFGPGPFAGVFTLVFGTVGFFGKLLAEEIEDVDRDQLDAVRAAGGNRLQVWLYGVVPQVVPRAVGLTVYRWDINIRTSTVIGIVGAGGIGATLDNSFNRYEFDFTLAILLVIVALVLFGELVSAYVRRRVQ